MAANKSLNALSAEIEELQGRIIMAPSSEVGSLKVKLYQKENMLKKLKAAGGGGPGSSATAPPSRTNSNVSTLSSASKEKDRTTPPPAAAAATKSNGSSPGLRTTSLRSDSGQLAPKSPRSEAKQPPAARAAPKPPPREKTREEMLEEQLIEALGTIDSLQKVVYEEQGKKEQAEKQVLQLKAEVVELSNTLQESLQSTNAEMLQQIESLQQSVLDYQRLYNELRAQHREKVMDESNSLLKSRVEDLSQSVTQLQRENAELKSQRSASSGSTGELEERVISLERTVLEYQEKYDALKKSNQDLMRQQKGRAVRKPDQSARMNEEVQNLTFQLYYGQSAKDDEIAQLHAVLRRYQEKYGPIS